MTRSIIYFDDICILCSSAVRFIYKNDHHGRFYFASLKSDHFEEKMADLEVKRETIPDSIVLIHRGKIYTRSAAALRITAGLRFPWPLFSMFYIIPRFLRNPLYDVIAKSRYQWFGKRETCFMPDEAMKARYMF